MWARRGPTAIRGAYASCGGGGAHKLLEKLRHHVRGGGAHLPAVFARNPKP
jgi:hypothetical protein